jgi:hypothetical protein
MIGIIYKNKQSKGGIATLYQNKDYTKYLIDKCTNIYLETGTNNFSNHFKNKNEKYITAVLTLFMDNVTKLIFENNPILNENEKIGISISLIELYFVINNYNNNHDNKIQLYNISYIGSGSYNIVLGLNNIYVLRINKCTEYNLLINQNLIDYNHKLSVERYNDVFITKTIYNSNIKQYLPEILCSSMDILPPEHIIQDYQFIPIWYVMKHYEEITFENINYDMYINLMINVLTIAKQFNLMYSDWRIDNIMYDKINNKYIITDFDFVKINDDRLDDIEYENEDENNIDYSDYDDGFYDCNLITRFSTTNNYILHGIIKKIIKNIYKEYDVLSINCETNRIYALFVGLYDIINIYNVKNNIVPSNKYNKSHMNYSYFINQAKTVNNYTNEFIIKAIENNLITKNIYDKIIYDLKNWVNKNNDNNDETTSEMVMEIEE